MLLRPLELRLRVWQQRDEDRRKQMRSSLRAIDARANSWLQNLACSPEHANMRRHSYLEMGA